MSTTRRCRTPQANPVSPSLDLEWLVTLARDLAERPPGHRPAELVEISHPPSPARTVQTAEVDLTELPFDDPVLAVVGLSVPPGVDAVGLVAGARSRPLHEDLPIVHGRLVHLLTRSGLSVTVLPGPARPLIGPTSDVQAGRVPDVCRRLLGLGTDAPPPADVGTVTHLWLNRVWRIAALGSGLGWGPVVAAHPFVDLLGDPRDGRAEDGDTDTALPTFTDVVKAAAEDLAPATVARWTTRCAAQWSWARFRRRVAEGHPDLVGHAVTPAQAAWMDDGMFARWVMGELATPRFTLDALEATLQPGALDRLRAAVDLSDGR